MPALKYGKRHLPDFRKTRVTGLSYASTERDLRPGVHRKGRVRAVEDPREGMAKFVPLEIVWRSEASLDELKGEFLLRGGHFRVKRRLTL